MVEGIYFDGNSSQKQELTLQVDANGNIIFSGIDKTYPFDSVKISSRVANTPRYLNFPDGSVFETRDNNTIDKLEAEHAPSLFKGLAHKLESHKTFVIFMLVMVIVSSWAFIQYGIPAFSKQLSQVIPDRASNYLGQGMLDFMDNNWLEETELSQEKQQRLTSRFNALVNNMDHDYDFNLQFRGGGPIQANAFALPDGTIIFTDELIKLAATDDEVVSIMLHEIGHVIRKHSLRSALQQFSLAMFAMVLTGDVSTSSSVVTALPLVLVKSGYSQNMETEADTFALEYMQQHNISPKTFVTMMEKLAASYSDAYIDCLDEKIEARKLKIEQAQKKDNKLSSKELGEIEDYCIKHSVLVNNKTDKKDLSDYFSTHPAISERIQRFRESQ